MYSNRWGGNYSHVNTDNSHHSDTYFKFVSTTGIFEIIRDADEESSAKFENFRNQSSDCFNSCFRRHKSLTTNLVLDVWQQEEVTG